jgi:hypothetical protein
MSIASTLIVNGTSYNQSARKTKSLLVDGFGWDLDGDYWLEFHEVIAGPQPQFISPFNCSLEINFGSGNVTVFTGQIIGYQPYFGAEGRSWSYRAMGFKYLANWIPVTAIDGSGTIRFNVSPADVFNFTPALAGQSVGEILSFCLTQHASALSAIGVTTDSTTATQLAALTLVPNNEVDVQGERLWIAMESVLQEWARNIRLVILPTGLVRAVDITAGTSINLELGSDPVDPPLLSANWQHTATAMTVRGAGLIEPGYVSTTPSSGFTTLTPAWTTAQQNAWTYADFLDPPGWTDAGSCTETSPTTVSVTSATSGFSVAVNAWSAVDAWIYLYEAGGTGLTFTESRQITSNTASSGGSYQVTLNFALNNTTYSSYKIIGNGGTLANSSLNQVWRLYTVTDPGRIIGDHLVRQFPTAVGFTFGNNQAALNTLYPVAVVTFEENPGLGNIPESGYPPFTVDPVNGQICFVRPVVEMGNSVSVLNQGGTNVKGPSDVTAFLAYSRGALETTFPTSGFQGTAFTQAGLERTGFCDVPSWTYFGNSPILAQLAQMLEISIGNTLMEGAVHYKGFYQVPLNPTSGSTPGFLLNFSAVDYTTGWESLNIPIRSYSVTYQVRGGGLNYVTDMRVSTRQDPRTGENYYAHLSVRGSGVFVPRGGETFYGGSFNAPDSSNPFGFQDSTPDYSGFPASMGNLSGNGRYSGPDTNKKRAQGMQATPAPLSITDQSTKGAPALPQSTANPLGVPAAPVPGGVLPEQRIASSDDAAASQSLATGVSNLADNDPGLTPLEEGGGE